MKFYKDFAALMCSKRRLLNMSQSELSKRTNLHRSAISRIEKGECNVLAHNLIMISKELKIPLTKIRSMVCEDRK